MTIQEATKTLRTSLESIYDPREASNIAGLVMEKLTSFNRIDRITYKDRRLSDESLVKLQQFSNELLAHRPLQYVLNEAWFFGRKFYVDENVLIPRPETEELVEWILQEISSTASVLDVGTGSGCIPISISKKKPDTIVYACDISLEALKVAEKNAALHSAGIQLVEIDILRPEAASSLPLVDLIVSNPPYIPSLERHDIARHVKEYEPTLALFVPDQDPLIFYRCIASLAKTNLKQGGAIYLEIHEKMGALVSDLFRNAGFKNIMLKKDMQGRDRMLRITN